MCDVAPLVPGLPVDDLWIYGILPQMDWRVVVHTMRLLSRRWSEMAMRGITHMGPRREKSRTMYINYLPALQLPNLAYLEGCANLVPETCYLLNSLKTLRHYRNTGAVLHGLQYLTSLTSLRVKLDVFHERYAVTANDIRPLTRLETLRLDHGHILNGNFPTLPHLHTLHICLDGAREDATTVLQSLPSLRSLTLSTEKTRRIHVSQMNALHQLTQLRAIGGVTWAGGQDEHLDLPNLRFLCYGDAIAVTPNTITRHPNLQYLEFISMNKAFRDSLYTTLSSLAQLRHLIMPIQDLHREDLELMTRLETLVIQRVVFSEMPASEARRIAARCLRLRKFEVRRRVVKADLGRYLQLCPPSLETLVVRHREKLFSFTNEQVRGMQAFHQAGVQFSRMLDGEVFSEFAPSMIFDPESVVLNHYYDI